MGDAARVGLMGGTAEAPCHCGGRGPLMKVSTYDGRQPLERYLHLFEDICVKNEFEENEWLLRLRIALSGSTVKRNCIGCSRLGIDRLHQWGKKGKLFFYRPYPRP